MNPPKLTPAQERALLRQLEEQLEHLLAEPPMSRDEAKSLLGQLPRRQGNETVGERLRRMTPVRTQQKPSAPISFRPLVGIERWAASSVDHFPLPDPGQPLESGDGRFRLWIEAEADSLEIRFEALGFAIDDFANQRVGLLRWQSEYADVKSVLQLPADQFIAVFQLDEDGDGSCQIRDSIETRQALLRPGIVLVEDE